MKNNFVAFKPHFDFLVLFGCYKIISPTSKRQESLHIFYRMFVAAYFFIFCIQHLIRLYQIQDNVSELVDTLYVLLTLFNSLGKLAIFNVRRTRIEQIAAVIKGPVFAPNNKQHEKFMVRNAREMKRLFRAYQAFVIFGSIMWMTYPLMTRFLGEEVRFAMYWPFSTDRLPVFLFAVVYIAFMVQWVSLSTAAMDCITVGFYMQAQLQLQMLRYNFLHIADTEDEVYDEEINFEVKIYKDVESSRMDNLFHKRLVMCIKRQQLIVWLVDEIESVFGSSMVLQFLVMAWIICMTVYKMIGLNVMSAEFVTMIVYLTVMLLQLFIFCYYGTQLKDESECLNQSIYESDWPAVSPRLRRPLLIMMERCYRPIAPCIAYIVPMSLDTLISVVKFSYSLYTFLDR